MYFCSPVSVAKPEGELILEQHLIVVQHLAVGVEATVL
jgi:hypothetical protein